MKFCTELFTYRGLLIVRFFLPRQFFRQLLATSSKQLMVCFVVLDEDRVGLRGFFACLPLAEFCVLGAFFIYFSVNISLLQACAFFRVVSRQEETTI